MLAADYEVVDGRYRFKKIYGAELTSALRLPLTARESTPGGRVPARVNGKELKRQPKCTHFENTAAKLIDITVGPAADGKDRAP